MKRLILLIAVGLLGGACVHYMPAAPVTPSSNPMHFDVTATEKDHAVTMRVGQTLEVVLHGGDLMQYQQVKSSDPSILEPTVDPAETAARGVTIAAFKATAAGQVDVTAIGAPVCPSGQACPMYALLYRLAVTVTP